MLAWAQVNRVALSNSPLKDDEDVKQIINRTKLKNPQFYLLSKKKATATQTTIENYVNVSKISLAELPEFQSDISTQL